MFKVSSKATSSWPHFQSGKKLTRVTLCVVSTDPRSGSIPVVLKDPENTEPGAEDSYSSPYRWPGLIQASDRVPQVPVLPFLSSLCRLRFSDFLGSTGRETRGKAGGEGEGAAGCFSQQGNDPGVAPTTSLPPLGPRRQACL